MAYEITEEDEEEGSCFMINTDARREKIHQLIKYQKDIFFSSSSSLSLSSLSSSISSATAYCSSFCTSRKSKSLLELMKQGSTSLRRLFDMEHTSLANHFNDYSGSPQIKPILLWGSDTDDATIHDDPWAGIRSVQPSFDYPVVARASEESCSEEQEGEESKCREEGVRRIRRQKLMRTKSFDKLPSFKKWKCKNFTLRLRLRLRVTICGRKF